MTVMPMPREKWTDERLDDLNKKVDDGFAKVDARFDRLETRMENMEARMQHLLLGGFAAIVAAVIGSNAL